MIDLIWFWVVCYFWQEASWSKPSNIFRWKFWHCVSQWSYINIEETCCCNFVIRLDSTSCSSAGWYEAAKILSFPQLTCVQIYHFSLFMIENHQSSNEDPIYLLACSFFIRYSMESRSVNCFWAHSASLTDCGTSLKQS